MSNVPTNLIPTRITGLPEYTGTSTLGYIPYILDGRTYKVQFGQIAAVGAVPSTRVIAAGTGLTGGGDLSENRVISIAPGGVGFDQLAVSGATAGTYGNSGNIPVVTVDSKGRVTNVETVPLVANGYVPTSRLVSAGVGLLGGGSLTDNITLSVNFYASAPQALGSATPGVSNAAARGDHVHPAVDLSDANQTQGALPLGRGGTGDALSPVAGAVVYSTGTKFALADPGIPGQVLTSAGTGEPYWQTIEGTGTVTSVAVLTGNGFAGTVNNPNTVAEITLSTTVTGLVKGNGTALSAAVAGTDYVAPGAITGSGLTMATDRLLGRTTALTGAVEQITVGSGLSLSAGVLSSTVGGTVTSVAASGGSTGLTFSGSPITTSGTLTLGGTLAVASGGTGATTAAGARTNLGAAASGANSDITSLSGITGSISTVDSITFDTATNTTPVAGETGWNIDFGTTTRGLGNGTIILDGMDLVAYCANAEATTLARGEVVYISGSTGSRATVRRAANTSDNTSAMTIGFVKDPIAAGASGYIVTQGVVDKLNLGAYASGDIIYLGATPGTFTNVQPYAPNHVVVLGVVERANAGNGQIYVKVNNGWELNELHNVSAQTPSNGQVIIYNASTSLWQAANLTAGTNVSITNGPGSITINASDQFTGTVTSVAASGGSTGLTFSGSPITTSGTLTLGGTLAVASGGTGATSAATARTNLGAAASGANTDITSIALTTGTITTAPTAGTDIANKAYVDTISAGINFHQAVRLASAAALPAYTYNNGSSGVGATITANANGALALDGVAAATNDRVLIKNETSGNAPYNGVYVVTQTGSGAAPFILTRASDFNTAGTGVNQIDAGDFFLVTAGSTQANTSWVQQTPLPITVGTTALVFTQFGAPITYSAGTGLTLAGTVFSIANTGVAATSYGSASAVPVIAVNAQGQITSASNTSIAISGSQVTSGSVAVAQGGTGATTASGARTNLGATTVGGNFFTLTNPSAITFIRVNADNTVSTLNAADFRTAIGAGTGGGSVTSVDASGGTTGLTFSGGPITTSGTLTLGGILGVANGGTGATTLTSNYLLKGNGVSSVSSSIIFDNGTNVGIGTASPTELLDVNAAAATTGYNDFVAFRQVNGTGTHSRILFGQNSTNNMFIEVADQANTKGNLLLQPFGGNVGIGTGSPARVFEVLATGTNIPARLGNSQGNLDIGGSDGVVVNIDTRSWAMGLQTGGTERMRITTAGLVGIGTSAPASRLDIGSGDLRFSGTGQRILGDFSNATIANRLAIQTTTASSATVIPIIPSAAGLNVGINLETDPTFTSGNVGQIVVVAGQEFRINSGNRGAGAYLPMTFYTNGSERMRITTAGLVGVGTSAPGYLLHGVQNGNAEFRVSATNVGTNSAGLTVENEGNRNWNLWANRSTDNFIIGANGRANDFLVINGSSGFVGIGTSSPSSRLTVQGDELIIPAAGWTSGQAARLYLGDANNGVQSVNGSYQTYFAFNGHSWNVNGSEAMRIDGSRNVGIGTSTPGYRLDVSGVINTNAAVRMTPTNVGAFTRAQLQSAYNLDGTGASVFTWNYTNGGGELDLFINRNGGGTGGLKIYDFPNTSGNPTNIFTVEGGGNVGIGTASPATSLSVVTNTTSHIGMRVTNNSTTQFAGSGLQMLGPSAAGTQGGAAIYYYNITVGGTQGAMAMAQLDSNGSFQRNIAYYDFNGQSWGFATNSTERMRIDSSGNVGIGTSSPGAPLEVAGDIRAAGLYQRFNNSGLSLSGGTTFNTGGAGIALRGVSSTYNTYGMEFYAGGSERMRIDSSGNVGIGTSSPSQKLDVNGSINAGVANGVSLFMADSSAIRNTATGGNTMFFDSGVGTGSTTGDFQFRSTGSYTTRFYINGASGNVGVGTTSPAGRLDVVSTSAGGASFMRVANGSGAANSYAAISLDPGNNGFNTRDAQIRAINNGSNQISLTFLTSNAGTPFEAMRIDNVGNVGIGTSGPAQTLQVANGSNYQFRLGAGSVFNYDIGRNGSDGLLYFYGNQASFTGYVFSGANGERMRINSSGEVLIGTTSGGRTVCINAADNWMRMSNPSRSWLIGMGTGSNFNIFDETGGGTRLGIDTSGNWLGTNSIILGAGFNFDNRIEVGQGRTGNNFAYIDLIGDTTYTDFGLRLLRGNGGPNTFSQLSHRGTGDFSIVNVEGAALTFGTSNSERFRVEATGAVSFSANSLIVGRNSASTDVNTANDTGSISIRGSTTTVAVMSFHRVGAFAINMGLGTDAVFRIGGWSASSNCFQMDASGNLTMLGNVTAYSDARIKKDVETIGSALDLVSKMRGVRYTRIDSGKRGVGVIAQEMLEVLPEVVQQGVGDDDTLSVAYGNLVGVLIEAVKELTARVAELEGK